MKHPIKVEFEAHKKPTITAHIGHQIHYVYKEDEKLLHRGRGRERNDGANQSYISERRRR